MRIFFNTDKRPREVAKALKRELAAISIELKTKIVQDIVATMYGYPDWGRLLSSIGTEAPSLPDTRCDESTVGSRRTQQIESLLTHVAQASAEAIVDRIRPTGTRLPGAQTPVEPWRRELAQYRAGLEAMTFDEPMNRHEDEGSIRRSTLRIGIDFVFSCSGDELIGGVIEGYWVRGLLLGKEDRIVAAAHGLLLKPDGEFEYDEMSLVDALDELEMEEVAYAVNTQSDTSLNDGPLLFLNEWVTTTEALPGMGLQLLGAFLKAVGESFGDVDTLLLDLAPSQFEDIPERQRLVDQQYRAAQKNLAGYWNETVTSKVQHGWNEVHFVARPMDGAAETVALIVSGREVEDDIAYRSGRQKVVNFPGKEREISPIVGLRGLLGPEATASRTSEAEPRPLTRFGYPAGRTGFVFQTRHFYDPHVDFWNHMPSEMVEMSTTFGDLHGDVAIGFFSFVFENGTELELDFEALMEPGTFPPMLRNVKGGASIVNPYTERYSSSDLLAVIRTNVSLLFTPERRPSMVSGNRATVFRNGSPTLTNGPAPVILPKRRARRQIGAASASALPSTDLEYAPVRYHRFMTSSPSRDAIVEALSSRKEDHFPDLISSFSPQQQAELQAGHLDLMNYVDDASRGFGRFGWNLFDMRSVLADREDGRWVEPVKNVRGRGAGVPLPEYFFLHFGDGRFPAPYDGVWIDGCYVSPEIDGGRVLVFTCGSETNSWFEQATDVFPMYRDLSRGFLSRYADETEDVETVVTERIAATKWKGLVNGPLKAARSCIFALRDIEMGLAVSGGVNEQVDTLDLADERLVANWLRESSPISFVYRRS